MHEWLIEDAGIRSPEWNMRADSDCLSFVKPTSPPLLRFYRWERPSATYGYFVEPSRYFDLEQSAQYRLQLARRPTGGGIIFHTHDLAFSVVIPLSHPLFHRNTMISYRRINKVVLSAIQPFLVEGSLSDETISSYEGFCMTKPTIYDIVVHGKKIGGAAQRKTKNGLLHQGSLSLGLPDRQLVCSVLKDGESVFRAMQETSAYIDADVGLLRQSIQEAFCKFS